MTFKHNNFDESATMRSLIKVAAEKGWVKYEPIQKTASASEDLTPSKNLTENVIKLCAGLRSSGLDKYADEIEKKFIVYKQANNLYNVHKEEGKDLVDAAHPKGGHKMEDLEGDALIETILEKQVKILNVVNKKPTGKLASHKDIMNAVKVVLSGDPAKITANLNKVLRNVNTIFSLNDQQNVLRKIYLDGEDDLKQLINSAIQNANNSEVLEGLCYRIKAGLASFYKGYKPGLVFGGVTDATWSSMEPLFASANAALDEVQKLLEEPDAPAPAAKKPLEDLSNQVSALKNKLNSYKSLLNDQGFTNEDRKQGNAWIDSYVKILENWEKIFPSLDADTAAAVSAKYEQKLQELKANVDAFYKQLVA